MNSVNSVRYSSSSSKSSASERASGSSNYRRGSMSAKPTHGKQDAEKKRVVCEQCTLRGHRKDECYTQCRYCKKRGHIDKHCLKKKKSTHHVDNVATANRLSMVIQMNNIYFM